MLHRLQSSALLLARCLILGVGTWLIVNGAAVFFLIKDQLA